MTAAYGRLHLRPEHFWSYTPRDIEDLLHGLDQRESYQDHKTDTRIGHILSSIYTLAQAWRKGNKKYTPEQFTLQWTQPKSENKSPVDRYNDYLQLKEEFNL